MLATEVPPPMTVLFNLLNPRSCILLAKTETCKTAMAPVVCGLLKESFRALQQGSLRCFTCSHAPPFLHPSPQPAGSALVAEPPPFPPPTIAPLLVLLTSQRVPLNPGRHVQAKATASWSTCAGIAGRAFSWHPTHRWRFVELATEALSRCGTGSNLHTSKTHALAPP
jgi:hypothetical protein